MIYQARPSLAEAELNTLESHLLLSQRGRVPELPKEERMTDSLSTKMLIVKEANVLGAQHKVQPCSELYEHITSIPAFF